jgi:lipopolysaccharide export system permease protein
MKLSAMRSMVAQEFRSGIWVKDNNNFINVHEMLPDTTLLGVRIYTYDDNYQLVTTRYAERGSYQRSAHVWQLSNVVETRLYPDHVESKTVALAQWASIIEPDILNVLLVVPEQMSA